MYERYHEKQIPEERDLLDLIYTSTEIKTISIKQMHHML